MVKPYTSGIRMTYEYIGVTNGWHTSTYECHTNDIRVIDESYDCSANDIRNIKLHKGFGAFRS